MPRFSKRSIDKLNSCDERLIKIMHDAIELIDFSVLCGHRGEEEQNKVFNEGRSNAKWGESKHNTAPSQAIDIAPYDKGIDWEDTESFIFLATIIFDIAAEHGVKIKWGGHFKSIPGGDMPHFELI